MPSAPKTRGVLIVVAEFAAKDSLQPLKRIKTREVSILKFRTALNTDNASSPITVRPADTRPTRCFLSYAKEDFAFAERLASDLTSVGIEVWFDRRSLTPGQKWRYQILKAIEDSDFFLALLSNKAITKRGYVQKEIREALNILETIPDDSTYLIPIRIESCKPVFREIRDLHWIDLFPNYLVGKNALIKTLDPKLLKKNERIDLPDETSGRLVIYDRHIAIHELMLRIVPSFFCSLEYFSSDGCSISDIYHFRIFLHELSSILTRDASLMKYCYAPLHNLISVTDRIDAEYALRSKQLILRSRSLWGKQVKHLSDNLYIAGNLCEERIIRYIFQILLPELGALSEKANHIRSAIEESELIVAQANSLLLKAAQ